MAQMFPSKVPHEVCMQTPFDAFTVQSKHQSPCVVWVASDRCGLSYNHYSTLTKMSTNLKGKSSRSKAYLGSNRHASMAHNSLQLIPLVIEVSLQCIALLQEIDFYDLASLCLIAHGVDNTELVSERVAVKEHDGSREGSLTAISQHDMQEWKLQHTLFDIGMCSPLANICYFAVLRSAQAAETLLSGCFKRPLGRP